jgi:hypothetical protein
MRRADVFGQYVCVCVIPHYSATFRPILLKGHDGPLTCVKYNKDGDLLFTTCRRGRINLWYSDDGERIGTYNSGAKPGAVMYVDVNCELTPGQREVAGVQQFRRRVYAVPLHHACWQSQPLVSSPVQMISTTRSYAAWLAGVLFGCELSLSVHVLLLSFATKFSMVEQSTARSLHQHRWTRPRVFGE